MATLSNGKSVSPTRMRDEYSFIENTFPVYRDYIRDNIFLPMDVAGVDGAVANQFRDFMEKETSIMSEGSVKHIKYLMDKLTWCLEAYKKNAEAEERFYTNANRDDTVSFSYQLSAVDLRWISGTMNKIMESNASPDNKGVALVCFIVGVRLGLLYKYTALDTSTIDRVVESYL